MTDIGMSGYLNRGDMKRSQSRLVEMIISRIGEEFDGECHLTEAEARLIASEHSGMIDRIRHLERALEPFVKDIENWTDENGWSPYAPSMERIRDWFGPSDFRNAQAVWDDKQ